MIFQTITATPRALGADEDSATTLAVKATLIDAIEADLITIRRGLAAFGANAFTRMRVSDQMTVTWPGGDIIDLGLIKYLDAQFAANGLPYRIPVELYAEMNRKPPVVLRVKVQGTSVLPHLRVLELRLLAKIVRLRDDMDALEAITKALEETNTPRKPTDNAPIYKQGWFWMTVIGSVAVLGSGYALMLRRYAYTVTPGA